MDEGKRTDIHLKELTWEFQMSVGHNAGQKESFTPKGAESLRFTFYHALFAQADIIIA